MIQLDPSQLPVSNLSLPLHLLHSQLLSSFSCSLRVPCHSLVLEPNNPWGFSKCHLEKCPWIVVTRKGQAALLMSPSFLVRH